MDGVNDRASYHLSSPVMSFCVLLDAPPGTPSLAQVGADQINQHLAQAEQASHSSCHRWQQLAQLMGWIHSHWLTLLILTIHLGPWLSRWILTHFGCGRKWVHVRETST